MESVKKAKHRMAQFPVILETCKTEAAAYAVCVIGCNDVKKHDCQQEFNKFLECARISATKMKIKLV